VVACIGVTGGLVHTIINQPAKAVATVGKVTEYRGAETRPEYVASFASMFASRVRTWAHYDVDERMEAAGYYMLPEVRDQVRAHIAAEKRSINRFKRRQQYEEYEVTYHGTQRKVMHLVTVTYRVIEGRGDSPEIYTVDRFARRMMFLKIVEGPQTTENRLGLYVASLQDVTEKDVMERRVVNPWDDIEGKVPDSKKTQAQEGATP